MQCRTSGLKHELLDIIDPSGRRRVGGLVSSGARVSSGSLRRVVEVGDQRIYNVVASTFLKNSVCSILISSNDDNLLLRRLC